MRSLAHTAGKIIRLLALGTRCDQHILVFVTKPDEMALCDPHLPERRHLPGATLCPRCQRHVLHGLAADHQT